MSDPRFAPPPMRRLPSAAAHWIWRAEVTETLALADMLVEQPLPTGLAGP